ncbi:MAG: hypothetical protein R3251_00360 [Candidatus Spechtbacterales bacterium]|nr:hypothetical protein [Candidatus Spechtbacterales bacterium]
MWESLKNILKTSNEKAVIVEDGEPRYVILSVDEYLRLSEGDSGASSPDQSSQPLSSQQQSAGGAQSFADAEKQQGQQQSSRPSITPKNQNALNQAGAEQGNSIFTEAIHPSSDEAPLDVTDIDTTDNSDIELADMGNRPNEIRLDDLPL